MAVSKRPATLREPPTRLGSAAWSLREMATAEAPAQEHPIAILNAFP
jgi:hypothetical protein